MEKKIKVLVVDDHQVVRKGLVLLLNSQKNIEVVQDESNAEDALDYLSKSDVDVMITDITMPGKTGIEMLKEMNETSLDVKTIVLSMHLDQEYITEALHQGAKGYLSKDADEKEIIEAVNTIYNGKTYLTRNASEILAKSYMKSRTVKKNKEETKLTKRELDVLKLIVEGFSNKQMADKLFISERTVSVHRYNLMKKLEAKNSADLVRICFELQLLN